MENARIYIVEDEAFVAEDIAMSLERMGYSVAGGASSGEEAIIAVGEIKPDLVLMDIKLQREMSGIEAASQIRARFNIPVVYLTSHTDNEVLLGAKQTEPFGYILKPFEEREMGRTIDIALYRHKMEMKAKWESDVNQSLSALYKPLIDPDASIEEICNTILDHAERLTGSHFGFVGTIDPATGDLVIHTFSEMVKGIRKVVPAMKKVVFHCGEDGRYPGLWGHSLNTREAFFSNKPEDHHASKGVPEGHLPLHRFLAVPVMLGEEPVGQIALAGKEADYTERDMEAVIRVSEFFALAIQKNRAGQSLQEAHDKLEERVRERTAELVVRNSELKREMTARVQMERQFIQSEKLASIGVLVSGVAHEINNPNNFITFNIPILRDYLNELVPIIDRYSESHPDFEPFEMTYPEFREDLFKILDNIEHGSHRINDTVSNLKDFSRKNDKIINIPVDIHKLIQKAVSISRGKIKRLVKTLDVCVSENMPQVHTDPAAVEHIIINLLINAAQASDKQDSWVAIHAKMGDRPKSFIVEVKDNGSGMDKETIQKLYEPFFTTKPRGEGTGLGLPLCHNLTSALGGEMEVESEPGKGSVFRLVLPDRKTGEETGNAKNEYK